VRTSNVGVKVGIVGSGVLVAGAGVNVAEGVGLLVEEDVGVGEFVETTTRVADGELAAGAQDARTKLRTIRNAEIFFMVPLYRNGHTSAGT
jgi:hypothetical protein